MIPVCHPRRVHFRSGQCRECWQGIRLLARPMPPRLAGVIQHALIRWPEWCPHCGAQDNVLATDGRRVECGACGYTGYVTSRKRVKFTFSVGRSRRATEEEVVA